MDACTKHSVAVTVLVPDVITAYLLLQPLPAFLIEETIIALSDHEMVIQIATVMSAWL